MNKNDNFELELAPRWREDEAYKIFNIKLHPEEYAARWAHTIGSSSFDQYFYRNRKLNEWIHTFHDILNGKYHKSLDEIRHEYLTEVEFNQVIEDLYDF